MNRIARVFLAISAIAEAGCYWPVPSCSEESDVLQKLVFPASRLVTKEDGAFDLDGRAYASCTELCDEQSGVSHVRSCEPPVAAPGPLHADGTHDRVVACHVDVLSCHDPSIVGGGIGGGRRPEGYRDASAPPRSSGAWLAEMARLEAASVAAFARLAAELAAHGAPPRLVASARRAMDDEGRHARAIGRLAKRFGGDPIESFVPPMPVRPLFDVAIENAVEGCVGETLGASLAAFQARSAGDRTVRRTMSIVERDETRHATLAWEVLAWSLGRLDHESRNRVHRAIRTFADCVDPAKFTLESAADRAALGLPSLRQATRIVGAARSQLHALRTAFVG